MIYKKEKGLLVANDLVVLRQRCMQPCFRVCHLPLERTRYHLSLQLHRTDGSILFSPVGLQVLSLGTAIEPVVLLLGDHYTGPEKAALKKTFSEILDALGQQIRVVELATEETGFYRILLDHYLGEERLVIWLGHRMDQGTLEVFRHFLARGGRLFMASLDFSHAPGAGVFLNDVFHVSGEPAWRSSGLRSAGLLPGLELKFFSTHAPFSRISSPSRPVLLNDENQAAGLRLDTGRFRAVYLPFDLRGSALAASPPLLAAMVSFLLDQSTAMLEAEGAAPIAFELQPNYPNPFNPGTVIPYRLPQKLPVALTVYNIAGQVVKHLVRQVQEAGHYQVAWEGRDEQGRAVGSGVYFCRLEAGRFHQTRRLVLLK